ncbi:hypothetical protein F5883DRAFT_435866 [Diaporthe sp. PMI_573]|nr:hypothetical protein F5883DRAFT_435866 [Diaporthaceae sp. PMI_573]
MQEDIAYCLLGIFDIHMPMLYGEGAKAVIRLQEEIMKVSDDTSILCWGYKQPIGEIYLPYQESSVLATHPRYFENCRTITAQTLEGFDAPSFSMDQRGLRIRLPVRTDLSHNKVVYGILACGVDHSPHRGQSLVAIPLISTSTAYDGVHDFGHRAPQNREYRKPTWCRPSLVSKGFLKQACLVDVLIRRPFGDDGPAGRQLPFALALPPIPSQGFDVLGTYPPQPVRTQFISYGDFTSRQMAPWTAKFKYPDGLRNSGILGNVLGSRTEWIGYAEEGQRMIQIQLSEGGVLVVLDYQAVTAKDLPGPVWHHELSTYSYVDLL